MTNQVELIYSLVIMVCFVLCVMLEKSSIGGSNCQTKRNCIIVETGVKAIDDYMKSIMLKKFAKNYYPYFAMVFCYILVSNLSSLIGFESPTSNYSITFCDDIYYFYIDSI